MRIALVTGASSGLGAAFAERIDATEKNIDEIWLIARRRERLEEAAGKLAHPARVLPMDLTEKESLENLEQLLAENIQVGLFVNCAGYGKIGACDEVTRSDAEHMIDLNCKAAVNLTMIILPYMRAGDRILEICSTASFQPVTQLNVYAASKSFLYSYTRALRVELLPRGIVVTAVCPWWISDTEFLQIAQETENSQVVQGMESPQVVQDNETNRYPRRAIRHFMFASKKDKVAKRALRASRMGFAVSTPGIMCTLHRIFSKLIPREVLLYIWELMRRV